MLKRKKSVIGAVMVLLFILSACSKSAVDPQSTGQSASSAAGHQAEAGSTWAMDIETVTLDQEPLTETAFQGNDLTIFNIWATWCPPCVGELPHLQEINERFAEKNVQVVGVLQDGVTESGAADNEVIEAAKCLLSDAGATYTMILPDETIMRTFIDGMQYFPTTFFVNAKGEIVETVVGANDTKKWEKIIDEVLEELEG